jgi:hypothetical protein
MSRLGILLTSQYGLASQSIYSESICPVRLHTYKSEAEWCLVERERIHNRLLMEKALTKWMFRQVYAVTVLLKMNGLLMLIEETLLQTYMWCI